MNNSTHGSIPTETEPLRPNQQNNAPLPITDSATVSPRKSLTQFMLNLLYASLILSALIGIGAIMFGNDEYGGKAVGTIMLLVCVDALLLIGLLPKVLVFRYGIWITSVLAFAFTTLAIWIPRPETIYMSDYPYEAESNLKSLSEVFGGIGGAFWLLLATIVALALVSLAEPLINKSGKKAKGFYWVLQLVALVGTLPLAVITAINPYTNIVPEFALKVYASTFILCATITIILGIVIIHNQVKQNQAKKDLNNRLYQQATQGPATAQNNFNGQPQQNNAFAPHSPAHTPQGYNSSTSPTVQQSFNNNDQNQSGRTEAVKPQAGHQPWHPTNEEIHNNGEIGAQQTATPNTESNDNNLPAVQQNESNSPTVQQPSANEYGYDSPNINGQN